MKNVYHLGEYLKKKKGLINDCGYKNWILSSMFKTMVARTCE